MRSEGKKSQRIKLFWETEILLLELKTKKRRKVTVSDATKAYTLSE